MTPCHSSGGLQITPFFSTNAKTNGGVYGRSSRPEPLDSGAPWRNSGPIGSLVTGVVSLTTGQKSVRRGGGGRYHRAGQAMGRGWQGFLLLGAPYDLAHQSAPSRYSRYNLAHNMAQYDSSSAACVYWVGLGHDNQL